MRRFIGNIDSSTKECSFSPDVLHHMKVVRLEKGEKIEVLCKGQALLYEVVDPYPLVLKWLEKDEVISRELPFESILLCPLLKKDNFEFVLQKSVELGVKRIVPFISSRVIKRVTKEEFSLKKERFMKILEEAMEQSNRDCQVELTDLYPYEQALKIPGDYKFFAYEDEAIKGNPIPEFKGEGKTVISLFGPEGGFSSEEASQAVENGFMPVSLGKRILRAETAAMNMLSVINYLGEKNE